VSREQIQSLFEQRERLGETMVSSGLVSQEKVDSALMEQNVVRQQRQRQQNMPSDSVKVSSHRLDAQMDLVGELVIALASLKLRAQTQNDTELKRVAENLDQLVTDLRDNVLGIRMLPIGGTFGKFRRLVRDLSNEQGKQIELLTEGAGTELDKSVIDQLSEPLVHLIRNSLDHGIERPADRLACGKGEKGHITLSAKHAQGHVIIQIEDDAKGIDADIVWNKVLEKGLAESDVRPTDKEVLPYIFAPGFSTAEAITNISGRGVGMDVVKQAIEGLRGSIDIDSTVGQGTCITLRLPLKLAIIDGLLVRVGSESLVLPLSAVEECVETTRSALRYSRRGQVIPVRDTLVPCLPLQNWVGQPSLVEDAAIQIVIVSLEGQRYGLMVDDVIGQEQIVIKSLGCVYQSIEGVSGATILGSGGVALILDLPKIIQLFEA
jgi:two-component system chemotaxis sensor kinase CheA